jgi:hypothetical protein
MIFVDECHRSNRRSARRTGVVGVCVADGVEFVCDKFGARECDDGVVLGVDTESDVVVRRTRFDACAAELRERRAVRSADRRRAAAVRNASQCAEEGCRPRDVVERAATRTSVACRVFSLLETRHGVVALVTRSFAAIQADDASTTTVAATPVSSSESVAGCFESPETIAFLHA